VWERFKAWWTIPEEREYGLRSWVEWFLLVAFLFVMGGIAIHFNNGWPLLLVIVAFVLFEIRHPWGDEMPG